MHLTLHITNKCNMRCGYCYAFRGNGSMTRDTAFAAVDMAASAAAPSCGLVFFGGEPLIERELICDIVTYSQQVRKKTGKTFFYKITTNGTLLDEEFLKFSRDVNMIVGFSHDGLAQDDFRVFNDGGGTSAVLEDKIPLLIHYQPYALAMCVVNPETAGKLSASIKYLFDRGFRYLIVSPNYERSAPWDRLSLAKLEAEYKKLGDLYIDWTRKDVKFYLSCFEMKISSHLRGDEYCEDRCRLGKKQISVAPDGKLYPCVQFVGENEYEMGDVFSGIDMEKRKIIGGKGSTDAPECADCAVKKRCNHTCGCLNRQATGSIDRVSPVQCTHERMLLPIADKIAEKLYKERNPLFLHKHYNKLYPVLSLIEDRSYLNHA